MRILFNKSRRQLGLILKKGFASEEQRRFMWAVHPDIAHKWSHDIPAGGSKGPHRMPTGSAAAIKGKKPKSKSERARIIREAGKLKGKGKKPKEKMSEGTKTITGVTDQDHDFSES